ncbi:MAG: S46 family peptidase [Saprospiraceae bacterium]
MLTRFLTTLLLAVFTSAAFANGGMWLPLLLSNLNEEEMQGLGMKLTAEDIYSINQGSLKDAIVHFGGFCTGEVISTQGLVLTNHHCGYGAIQSHSTLEDNVLENGFYAKTKADEKPNPGLFVTFIDRIVDASDAILQGVTFDMEEDERRKLIQANTKRYKQTFTLGAFEEVLVKPFYNGNQYFAFVTRKYNDVRLVGTPPNSVGKFGADTDNWEWPRHTGDFSLFRVYAAADGSPAEYAETNVPYTPKKHLEVSTSGVKPGDFSMIFGFPGRTDQYLPASAMRQRVELINPIRIGMRDLSLAVIDSAMRGDAQTKIDYASKQSRIANAWKKWRGESEGVKATNGIALRNGTEFQFNKRLNRAMMRAAEVTPAERMRFLKLLPQLDSLVALQEGFAKSRAYTGELNYNVDLFRIANIIARRVKVYDAEGLEGFKKQIPRLAEYLEGFYARYNPSIDQQVAQSLLDMYFDKVEVAHQSKFCRDQHAFAGSTAKLADVVFGQSYLSRGELLVKMLREHPEAFVEYIKGDPGFQFVRMLNGHNEQFVTTPYNEISREMAPLQRDYMKALMQVFPDKKFYPDANSTMRVSYGKFEGFKGLDGKDNSYMTYLDGVVSKYKPGDYEFDVPAKVLELHKKKNYGKYATKEGKLPVCILGSNHTTGGNSGSPALDANGRLVGLNFDRTWQSTMSDINYDPSICRNIMVDIRYVLWLIDKVGGAPHLVEEMSLVK